MSFYQDYNDKLAFEQWNTRRRPDYRHIQVTPIAPALGADALWLAELVAQAFADGAENWGLAALLATQHARAASRFTAGGDLVRLADQDRALWNAELLQRGRDHLAPAAPPSRWPNWMP